VQFCNGDVLRAADSQGQNSRRQCRSSHRNLPEGMQLSYTKDVQIAYDFRQLILTMRKLGKKVQLVAPLYNRRPQIQSW
jgi:hypothetical protein